jgi:hypothetical protein
VKVGREGVLVGGRCDVDVELVQRGGEGAGGGALEAGDREASLDEGLRVWIEVRLAPFGGSCLRSIVWV